MTSHHMENNRSSSDPEGRSGRHVWKWLLAGAVGLLVAGALLLVVSMTLLDEEWLKRQLVTQAREAFDIDLKIESLEFHPWQGEADLRGVTFEIEKPNQDIHGEIQSLHVELVIWPLFFREVDVENLNVTDPRVTYVLDRPAEPEQRATFDRVAEKVVEVIGNILVQIIEELLDAFRAKKGYDIRIGHLTVAGGIVDCTVNRPGVEPVHVLFENLDYTASDLRPSQRSFGAWGYVSHADMSADLRIGDAKIGLEHQFAAFPRVIRIANLDLEQVDRLGSQKDAIVFQRGTLDLLYEDRRDQFEVDATFTGLQLAKNEEADLPDFLFMPVEHLIAYVEKNDGNLALQFTHDRKGAEASDDMEFVIAEVWNGMWAEVLKRVQAEAGDELKDWEGLKLLRIKSGF